MFRRHDKLGQLAVTVFAALVCGLFLEAEGLRIWAERLGVGPWRDLALPVTRDWFDLTRPFQVSQPRALALQAKAALADDMVPTRTDKLAQDPPSAGDGQAEPLQVAAADGADLAALAPLAAKAPPGPAAGPVVLSGDSMMAVGLAPTLTRWLAKEKNARVIRAFRSGTGLSRPEVYDWLVEYPRMVGQIQPAIIICAMGANDAQNVQVGKKVLNFGSPEWDAFYNARLAAYLQMITRNQAQVLWVGLPEMKSPVFAQKMAHMNALIKAGLAPYANATFLDSNQPLGYTGHGFQQFKTNDKGKLIKLRADDGIHLTDEGAQFLVPNIGRWLDKAAGDKAMLAAPAGKPAPAVQQASVRPLRPAANPAQVATAPAAEKALATAAATVPEDLPPQTQGDKPDATAWLSRHIYPQGWGGETHPLVFSPQASGASRM